MLSFSLPRVAVCTAEKLVVILSALTSFCSNRITDVAKIVFNYKGCQEKVIVINIKSLFIFILEQVL